ncbi:hypothetical protein ACQKWADRAFT_293879 [Trichoderma austrokoningii]
MSLGALMKAMKGMKLLGPRSAPPYEGYSIKTLRKALCKITTPDYQVLQRSRSELDEYGSRVVVKSIPHLSTCYLSCRIRPIVDEQYYNTVGLKLEDFIDMSKKT